MHQDEYRFLLDENVEFHPKRYKYLLAKWKRKGWHDGNDWTEKGLQEKNIVKSTLDYNYVYSLCDRIVIIEFVDWLPILTGYLRDCGDNGIHFYTRKTTRYNYSYFLGNYASRLDYVASIRLHPNPRKIFNRLNYIAWKASSHPVYKQEDAFHVKWANMRFWHQKPDDTHSCHPSCQCRNFP